MSDKPTVLDVLEDVRSKVGGFVQAYEWLDRIELAWRREREITPTVVGNLTAARQVAPKPSLREELLTSHDRETQHEKLLRRLEERRSRPGKLGCLCSAWPDCDCGKLAT